MKGHYVILILLLVLIAGCTEEEIADMGLHVNLSNEKTNMGNTTGDAVECPQSCDDDNSCTEDSCSEDTGFECMNKAIPDCCGNDVCEDDEDTQNCAADCPECAEPAEKCKTIEFNYETGKCEESIIKPCCGNDKCEIGEDSESCDEDCEISTGFSLSNYPNLLSGSIVLAVGDDGKAADIFAATTIGNALYLKGKTTETLTESKIADIDSQDMIVIGRPCENGIWDELLGVDSCDDWLGADKGIIKLIENNGHEVIFISGDTPENTQKLAEVLAEPEKYTLSGTEMEATISGSSISLS